MKFRLSMAAAAIVVSAATVATANTQSFKLPADPVSAAKTALTRLESIRSTVDGLLRQNHVAPVPSTSATPTNPMATNPTPTPATPTGTAGQTPSAAPAPAKTVAVPVSTLQQLERDANEAKAAVDLIKKLP